MRVCEEARSRSPCQKGGTRWNQKCGLITPPLTHQTTTAQSTATPKHCSEQQHMKLQKGLRQQRRRRSMPARVLSGTAVLAAAWSLPQRCCHALRASLSSMAVSGGAGYQYRSYVGTARSYVGTSAQRASRTTTASLAGGFVPGGAGRRKAAAAAAVAGSTSRRGFGTGATPAGPAAGSGTTRMVSGGDSDESAFFTDPDAPEEVDGAGPPGPLVGGDQVRAVLCGAASQRELVLLHRCT